MFWETHYIYSSWARLTLRKSQKRHHESLTLSHSQEMKRFKSLFVRTEDNQIFSSSHPHVHLFFQLLFLLFFKIPVSLPKSFFHKYKRPPKVYHRETLKYNYLLSLLLFSSFLTTKAFDSACTPYLPWWRDSTLTPGTQFLPNICCVLATPQAFFSSGCACFQRESITSFFIRKNNNFWN